MMGRCDLQCVKVVLTAAILEIEKENSAIAASAAAACRAIMGIACLGVSGTHLIAKYATIGIWAISSN